MINWFKNFFRNEELVVVIQYQLCTILRMVMLRVYLKIVKVNIVVGE